MEIDIVSTGWPNHPSRVEYTRESWEALRGLLCGCQFWHYCSAETTEDPDHPFMRNAFIALCEGFDVELHWREAPADLGANINAATRLGSNEFMLFCQDDHVFRESLDIGAGAVFLQSHPEYCAIRYHYTERTQFTGTVDGYKIVNMEGPWPFADGPSLRRRSMHTTYGEQDEGRLHGAAEWRYGRQLKERGAKVVCYNHPIVKHIGSIPAVIDDPRNARRESKR